MNRMRLTVLTAEATILETELEYVNLPMEFGSLGILPGHEQMLCKLASGILRGRFDDDEGFRVRIGSGLCRVENNESTCLVDSGEILE